MQIGARRWRKPRFAQRGEIRERSPAKMRRAPMIQGEKPRQSKRPYHKPRLEKLNLVPSEAVLQHCKNPGWGPCQPPGQPPSKLPGS